MGEMALSTIFSHLFLIVYNQEVIVFEVFQSGRLSIPLSRQLHGEYHKGVFT